MDDDIGPLKKILKGSSIILVGMFMSKLLAYIYRLLVARIGPEQYGLLSISIGIVGLLTTLSLLGLNRGVSRYIPFYIGKKDNDGILILIREALKITTLVSLPLSIILFIFSDYISIKFFNNILLSPILKISSFSIFFGAISMVLYDIILAFQKIKYQILLKNLLGNIIKIVLTFILVYLFSFGVIGAAYASLIAIVISTILAFYIINKYIFNFITARKIFDKKNIRKEILFYSTPLMFSGILISITSWTDTIMLGYFKQASDVGIYNAALPTAQLIYIIPYVFMLIFLPVLSELYAKEKKEVLNSVYSRVTKWIFFLNFILFSFFLLFSKIILTFLFGSEYTTGSSSLIILSFGFYIGYLLLPTETVFMILKKTRLIFIITLAVTLTNVILNFSLIPKFGIIGAAMATAISHILAFIIFASSGYKTIKLNPFKVKYFINIIILFTISIAIYQSTQKLLVLIPLFLLFILLTFLLLLITKTIDKEDIFFIKTIINKLKNYTSKIS